MTRTYVDFDLLVQRSGRGYRSRVLDSPAGNAGEDFVLPFEPLRLENFILRIGRALGEWRRDVRRLETSERGQVREFGTQLFEAVFRDSVLSALRGSIERANAKDAGVRIRLRLTDVPELSNIPWEYLYDPTTNQFLCLAVDTPVVRYLDLPYGARPLAVSPPLRILVMVSSPDGVPPLDVATEIARLNGEDALGELIASGQVALHVLERATLSALRRQLRRGQYHIFHFIGHGGFDESSQDGALLLEDEDGNRRLVTGQDLGVMLNGHRSLRLAVLNACEGARAAANDPYAGVATSLLQQGVPAVIAMQFEITDRAAITFAHEFYGALADGYPIDAGVTEARRAIFALSNEVEWATPVLYLRAPTGRIFRVNPRTAGPTVGGEDADVAPVGPAEAEPTDAERVAERVAVEQEAARRREAEEWAAEERAREARARDERDRAARARAAREEAERREVERRRLERAAAERERLQREAEERTARLTSARRRRRRAILAGVGALVVVAIVAAFLFRPDPGPDEAEAYPSRSLFSVGDEGFDVVDRFPDFGDEVAATEMRARDGDIWVAGDAAVARVDDSGRTVATIAIEGPLSDFAFSAGGEAWVVHGGLLSEIDTTSNQLQEPTPIEPIPEEVVVGTYVWVLARSDPTVGEPDSVIRLDTDGADPRMVQDVAGLDFAGGVDIAISETGIWVADRAGSRVIKIDPGTELEDPRTIAGIEVEHAPDGIVADRNFVYVFSTDRGTVSVIDSTLQPGDRVEIGHSPVAIRPGLGAVWTLNGDGTVTRIDPNTLQYEDIPLPAPARAMTIDNDRQLIWIVAR